MAWMISARKAGYIAAAIFGVCCSSAVFCKEWCEVPGKGGYFADKCPVGTAAKKVKDPEPPPERWEPIVGRYDTTPLWYMYFDDGILTAIQE